MFYYYHVISNEGVIYETTSEYSARMIEKAIKGATIRAEGDLSVLRKKAERQFGRLWLRGPSNLKQPMYAEAA